MDWNSETLIRLLLAAVLGGLIGTERERMNRAAGLRTHVMVSLGSALFTVLSIYAFHEEGRPNDPARIAAQIVSGIGFLGAGTIMKHGATVKGLTTAATLWVVAAIGMAAGAGYYAGATLSAVVALLTLIYLRDVERLVGGKRYTELELSFSRGSGHLSRLHQELDSLDIVVQKIELNEDDDLVNVSAAILVPEDVDQLDLTQRLRVIGAKHIDLNG